VKILIDAQLPPNLKIMLAEAGHEALHVVDVGLRDAEDAQVWGYAVQQETAILTKDEDSRCGVYVSRSAQPSFGLGSETALALHWYGG
jgi:predicted nuclease of predicted toxin-antitoxin system